MSNKIDVLALLDKCHMYVDVESDYGEEYREARNAIAELIEASENVRGASSQADWRRLEAALANVRGNKET